MKFEDPSGTAVLFGFLLKKAWPVWKAHQGIVPDAVLRELELRGDWPHGLAKAIMRRISCDADLRKQLEEC